MLASHVVRGDLQLLAQRISRLLSVADCNKSEMIECTKKYLYYQAKLADQEQTSKNPLSMRDVPASWTCDGVVYRKKRIQSTTKKPTAAVTTDPLWLKYSVLMVVINLQKASFQSPTLFQFKH